MKIFDTRSYSLGWRSMYGIEKILSKLFGKRLALKIFLRLHWHIRRIAFEQASEYYGDAFQNNALGISENFLLSMVKRNYRVLDLGCGSGRWSLLCATKAQKVLGIDSNSKSIDAAKLAAKRNNLDNLEFKVADAMDEIRNLSGFDLVILVHFLEHLKHPKDILKLLRKRVKRIVVEVPDFASDPLNYVRVLCNEPFYYDYDHTNEYTLSEIVELLEECKWEVEKYFQSGGTIVVVAS